MTTTISTPDDHLDRVTALQTVFKNPVLAKVCAAICSTAVYWGDVQDCFWPDEVPLEVAKADSACIGISYRILGRTLKCIERVEPIQARPSTAKGRNGSMVYLYRVTDRKLCGQIARLEWNPQGEMAL